MLMLEWILVLLLAAVILTNLAERLAVPYPSLLAIAGTGLAFLPFAPQLRIEPEGSSIPITFGRSRQRLGARLWKEPLSGRVFACALFC